MQNPIESKYVLYYPARLWLRSLWSFIKGRIDAMNAEIALGTVATVGDAVRWLGYTYLFARMQKNPWLYGGLFPRDDHHIINLIVA